MRTNLEEVQKAVLGALMADGYSLGTVYQYEKHFDHLRAHCMKDGGEYSKERGAEYVQANEAAKSDKVVRQRLSSFGRFIRVVDSYVETGVVCFDKHKRPPLMPQSEEFVFVLGSWEEHLANLGFKKSTRAIRNMMARRYTLYLEELGISSVKDAEPNTTHGFLESLRSTWSARTIRSFLGDFKLFLEFAGRQDLAFGLVLPAAGRRSDIISVLTEEEAAAIHSVMKTDKVTLRDKAMVTMAMLTGMRAVDIISLTLDDISWASSKICTVQSKTGHPITLPMLPALGNAVSAYLLNERPMTADRNVFIRTYAPHKALSSRGAVEGAIMRVFKLAGVDSYCFGTRITRHSLASRMLTAQTPLPTISAVLGHADPRSSDVYITTDADGMRACILPLPKAVG